MAKKPRMIKNRRFFNGLGPLGLPTWRPTWLQNRSPLEVLLALGASCQKTKKQNQTFVFQWFWAPRPANLEAKMAPKSIQDRSKIDQKIDWKLDRFFDRFLVDLGSVLGRFGRPSWAQNRLEIGQKSVCKPIENMIKKCTKKGRPGRCSSRRPGGGGSLK